MRNQGIPNKCQHDDQRHADAKSQEAHALPVFLVPDFGDLDLVHGFFSVLCHIVCMYVCVCVCVCVCVYACVHMFTVTVKVHGHSRNHNNGSDYGHGHSTCREASLKSDHEHDCNRPPS